MNIYRAEVVGIEDIGKDGQVTDGDRIRVRLLPEDRSKEKEECDYAFPLLPKMLHVKPKVGEQVFVIVEDENRRGCQRYYIGPIISQPQFIKYDDYALSASSLLQGSLTKPDKAPSINADTHGSMCDDNDIAIYGRGDTDIILSDDDLLIRCGSRKFGSDNSFIFNRKNPSYIKLKEHNNKLIDESETSATIVADSINLLSHKGSAISNGGNPLTNGKEQISEDTYNEILEKAHVLPYGDILVDFLTMFLQMFKSHTHKYPNLPPCPDELSKKLDIKYGSGDGEYDEKEYDYSRGTDENKRFEDVSKTFKGLGEKLLSKHVRIN